MKKLRNNHETLCYFVLKPLFNMLCEKNGLQSLSWHYLRNKLPRKTCRVAPFPLDDIIERVCFDFRLAFPPGDIGQACVFWFKTSESWPGLGTTSLGNMEAKGKVAGQPTPDADSNDHLREAVKMETPIFGQALTKGAMLNFPTPTILSFKLLHKQRGWFKFHAWS